MEHTNRTDKLAEIEKQTKSIEANSAAQAEAKDEEANALINQIIISGTGVSPTSSGGITSSPTYSFTLTVSGGQPCPLIASSEG